jgi:hypothetical protein
MAEKKLIEQMMDLVKTETEKPEYKAHMAELKKIQNEKKEQNRIARTQKEAYLRGEL